MKEEVLASSYVSLLKEDTNQRVMAISSFIITIASLMVRLVLSKA